MPAGPLPRMSGPPSWCPTFLTESAGKALAGRSWLHQERSLPSLPTASGSAGPGFDVTVSESEGTFEKIVHKTVCGDSVKYSVCVPDNARGLLLVKVAIPESDRADWDARLEDDDMVRLERYGATSQHYGSESV